MKRLDQSSSSTISKWIGIIGAVAAAIVSVILLWSVFAGHVPQFLINIVTSKTGWALIVFTVLSALAVKFLPVKKWFSAIIPQQPLSHNERLYLLLCGAVYIFWAIAFVSWSYGPDEAMRYDIPLYIFQNNALPFGNEEAIRNETWGSSYGFFITAPNLIAVVFMKIMALFSKSPVMLLIAARMVSVLSMMGAGYFAIRITRRIFRTPTRWIFIVLATMTPQLAFLSSYVNNDAYAYCIGMMTIYAWICGLESKWNLKSCVLLAISAGLNLIGYRFYWSFVLCSLFVYIASFLRHCKNGFPIKRFLKHGLIIIGVAVLVCGGIYLRNLIIYDGDVFGSEFSSAAAEMYAADGYRPSQLAQRSLQTQGVTLNEMFYSDRWNWLENTFESLFYRLGYMNVHADDWILTFYDMLCKVGIVGVAIMILRGKATFREQVARSASLTGRRFYEWFVLLFFILLAGAITFSLSVYYSYTGDFQAQGRYIMAAAPGIFLLVAYSIDSIINLFASFVRKDATLVKRLVCVIIGSTVIVTMLNGFMQCMRVFGGHLI